MAFICNESLLEWGCEEEEVVVVDGGEVEGVEELGCITPLSLALSLLIRG